MTRSLRAVVAHDVEAARPLLELALPRGERAQRRDDEERSARPLGDDGGDERDACDRLACGAARSFVSAVSMMMTVEVMLFV